MKKLFGHHKKSAQESFQELADYCEKHEVDIDSYGRGSDFVAGFEDQIAGLCGFEAGLFVPTGAMSQQIALRIWCEKQSNFNVALHPSCQLENREHKAYQVLHGMKPWSYGEYHRPLKLSDFEGMPDVAAGLIELPNRWQGGTLPTWKELQDIKALFKSRQIFLHMDGARLWETAGFYKKSYAQICEGFDSVYVSLYKGIGALSGSLLLSSKEFVEEARIWLKRHGGAVNQVFPNIVSAKLNFEKRIEMFPQYFEKTVSLVASLKNIADLWMTPEIAQCNLFHIRSQVEAEILNAKIDSYQQATGVRVIPGFIGVEDGESVSGAEFYVGDATLDWPDDEIVSHFRSCFG